MLLRALKIECSNFWFFGVAFKKRCARGRKKGLHRLEFASPHRDCGWLARSLGEFFLVAARFLKNRVADFFRFGTAFQKKVCACVKKNPLALRWPARGVGVLDPPEVGLRCHPWWPGSGANPQILCFWGQLLKKKVRARKSNRSSSPASPGLCAPCLAKTMIQIGPENRPFFK